MKLLDSISIRGKKGKRIELYQGDLTSLRPDEAVDLLVVSALVKMGSGHANVL